MRFQMYNQEQKVLTRLLSMEKQWAQLTNRVLEPRSFGATCALDRYLSERKETGGGTGSKADGEVALSSSSAMGM